MCRHSFNGKEQEHTNGCIVDVAVIFDSLKTLSIQQSDHVHFSWTPSRELHDQLLHWRHMDISLSWETDGRMSVPTAELLTFS
jgi:hypothetical protein